MCTKKFFKSQQKVDYEDVAILIACSAD